MERLGYDDAAQGQHSYIGRTAADVDDHIADRVIDGQIHAESRSSRRFDEEGFLGAGLIDGFHDGPFFDIRRRRRYADHDAQALDAADALAEDIAQHRPGYTVIGDDAVDQRPMELHRFRRPGQ